MVVDAGVENHRVGRAVQRRTRQLLLSAVALALTASICVADSRPTFSLEVRTDGGIIAGFDIYMTGTAGPDYFPPPDSPVAIKLFFSNQALKNKLLTSPTFSEELAFHRSPWDNPRDMTVVIGPGTSEADAFSLLSGTDLPVGYSFGGRGGKPGMPEENPVNLSGAPDAGTATIRACWEAGPFISSIAAGCKFVRRALSTDSSFAGAGPDRVNCPANWSNTLESSTNPSPNGGSYLAFGAGSGPSMAHVTLVTNDAGPVNRSWGPIPGNTGDPADYDHPNGQLWDVKRQKWAYARWTVNLCWTVEVGGLLGNQVIVRKLPIFIYKDEPVPGAYTFSMINSYDARVDGDEGYSSLNYHACGVVFDIPNICFTPHEIALAIDLSGALEVARNWKSIGTNCVSFAVSDGGTWHGSHTATGTVSLFGSEICADALVPVSGTFTNSSHGRVSVYSVATGQQVATGFSDADGKWSYNLAPSLCSEGGGYKILAEAPEGFQGAWYKLKYNYSQAACVDAPSSDNNMVLAGASPAAGYVKDADNGADLDGTILYFFDSSAGTFAGWTLAGRAGPGRYTFEANPGTSYKVLAKPPPTHQSQWYSGAGNYTEASAIAPPAEVDFSLEPANYISGYVKDAATAADIDNAILYFYRADTGAFAGWTKSGLAGPGRYQMGIDPSASYKVLVRAPAGYEDRWFDGASGFVDASATAPPAVADFSLREAGLISGQVTQGGVGLQGAYISAYTTCGCKTPVNTLSGTGGVYSLKVPTTAASGDEYRVRFIPPSGQARWYLNAIGFGGATDISAPASGIDQETPP